MKSSTDPSMAQRCSWCDAVTSVVLRRTSAAAFALALLAALALPAVGQVATPGAGYLTNLNVNTTPVGSGADTTADTLMSFTVPANTLVNVGDTLHLVARGTTPGTTDNKVIHLQVGAGAASATNNSAPQTTWFFEMWVTKTGPNAQAWFALINNNTNNTTSQNGTLAAVDTAGIAVLLTGQNTTAATAGSVVAQFMYVECIRAP